MSSLFNRRVKISIIEPTKSAGKLTAIIEDLDIEFSITKENNHKKNPNLADIKIFNLNSRIRKFLSYDGRLGNVAKGTRIIVEAGYEKNMEVIFVGDIIKANSFNNGTDWETEIEAIDGAGRLRGSRVNNTYKAGVSKSNVVKDLIINLALELGNSFSVADTIPGKYNTGKTFTGKTIRELNKILSDHDLEVSIQNRVVQIVKKGGTLPRHTVLISPTTGMIGSPEFGSPEKKKKKNPIFIVTSLLQPSIIPSSIVTVSSKEITKDAKNVDMRVIKVEHTGSTFGNDWYTEVECTKV